jgi:coproporphyrinogen III oxidase
MSNLPPIADRAREFFLGLQERITSTLEAVDGGGRFREDAWTRPGGGGGRTRLLAGGALFEKAGVGFSDVQGALRPEMARALPGEGLDFRATGVSLIFHPHSPRIPTVHANVRHIQRGGQSWFGGGMDLTPYYVVPDDAVSFHRTLRDCCARHDASFYPRFKRWCDDYFFLPHRNEPRGAGGIFFDHHFSGDAAADFAFVRDVGLAFLDTFPRIVRRRMGEPWTAAEREHQLIRRGRYAEFNLIHDRGTLFGLKTGGNVDAILMSLPPEVKWP